MKHYRFTIINGKARSRLNIIAHSQHRASQIAMRMLPNDIQSRLVVITKRVPFPKCL